MLDKFFNKKGPDNGRQIITQASYRVLHADDIINRKISQWASRLARCWKGPQFNFSFEIIKNKIVFKISFPQGKAYTEAFARWLGGVVRGDKLLYALPL